MEQNEQQNDQLHDEAPLITQSNNRALNVCVKTVTHPLIFANTLIKLGHDPYPLSIGKKWLFFGDLTYFRLNVFKYLSNVYQSHGFATIYTGIGANLTSYIAGDFCSSYAKRYMDQHYPEIGGSIDDLLKIKNVRELNTHQLILVKFHHAIRDSISRCIGIVAARPFMVIMVRQIAQYIGSETKYTPFGLIQPILCIGTEEGPAGFFSGLIPQLVGEVCFIWGTALVTCAVEHGIRYLEKDIDMNDEQTVSMFSSMRFSCGMLINWALGGWRYRFDVVSTMLAVTGSGLAVSMLPFSPQFTHWTDAYDFLLPYELLRGQKIIFRAERGPVAVGVDGKLYACKKDSI